MSDTGGSGNSIKQDSRVVNGTEAKNDQISNAAVNHADHGPTRFDGKDGQIVAFCKNGLMSLNGWSAEFGYAIQPNIRGNTGGNVNVRYNVCDNVCESGGTGIISFELHASLTVNLPRVIVVDSNLMIGSHATYDVHEIRMTNSVWRNQIFIIADVASSTQEPTMGNNFANLGRVFAFKSNFPQAPANLSGEFIIQNYTVIDLRTVATNNKDLVFYNQSDVDALGWTNFQDKDNHIFYAPSRSTPLIGDAPLDTTPTGLVSGVPGVSHENFSNAGNGYAPVTAAPNGGTFLTPASAIALYAPLTGSGAIGRSLPADTAICDFNGDFRRANKPAGRVNFCDGAIESKLVA
jgi:hypothetical protein